MKSWEQFWKDNSPRCYHTVIGGAANKDDLRVSVNDALYRAIQLESLKAGMMLSETITQQVDNPFQDKSQRAENYGAKWMRDMIALQIKQRASSLTQEEMEKV